MKSILTTVNSIVLLLLLFLGLTLVATQAQARPMSLADYRARLVDALATAEAGGDVTDALAALPSVEIVSGDIVAPVSLVPGDGDPVLASIRLSIAIEQIDLSAGDDTAVRLAQLERVASRLDLLQPSLWERFVRWLWQWLERLLPERSPIAGGAWGDMASSLVGWSVIGVGGLLLVLLLSYWLRRLLAGLLSGRDVGDPLALAGGMPASAAQARQQASHMAESGNYREAVRRLYLAALLRLRERELVRFDSSQTNREVLAAVPVSSSARTHLEPVVETFDRVWYGEREPDAATFHSYSQEIDALLAEQPRVTHG